MPVHCSLIFFQIECIFSLIIPGRDSNSWFHFTVIRQLTLCNTNGWHFNSHFGCLSMFFTPQPNKSNAHKLSFSFALCCLKIIQNKNTFIFTIKKSPLNFCKTLLFLRHTNRIEKSSLIDDFHLSEFIIVLKFHLHSDSNNGITNCCLIQRNIPHLSSVNTRLKQFL